MSKKIGECGVISQERLQQLKVHGFPPEECPACFGEDSTCDICGGTGVVVQRVDAGWQSPELKPGEWLEAYLGYGEWEGVGVMNEHDQFVEVAFPFNTTGFATSEHMESLGFRVIS